MTVTFLWDVTGIIFYVFIGVCYGTLTQERPKYSMFKKSIGGIGEGKSLDVVNEVPTDDERATRKEQLLQVAQRVQSEYSFRFVASGDDSPEDLAGLSSTNELMSSLKSGVFRLSPGNPFNAEKVVLWKGLANSGFTLVCEKDENRLIAENVLDHVIRHLQEYCQIILQPSEAILKVDRVVTVIYHFLPNGQLLFMNTRYLRQVEKELEQVMSLKKE